MPKLCTPIRLNDITLTYCKQTIKFKIQTIINKFYFSKLFIVVNIFLFLSINPLFSNIKIIFYHFIKCQQTYFQKIFVNFKKPMIFTSLVFCYIRLSERFNQSSFFLRATRPNPLNTPRSPSAARLLLSSVPVFGNSF